MRLKKIIVVIGVALALSFSALGVLSAYTKHDLTKNLETLFAVFRDAMLMDVDEPDPQQLTEGAIRGLLKELDPYTEYIPESSKADLQFMTTGEYAGIGAVIQKAGDYAQIVQLYENTPALHAGLKAGDTLLMIDHFSLKGVSVTEVSNRLKGKEGSKLTLTIHRPYVEGEQKLEVTRARIQIPSVAYSTRLPGDVAYVNLAGFTTGCAEEIRQAIEKIRTTGEPLRGIVLDLRGNTGGLLNEAVALTSLFVASGTKVADVKGRSGSQANPLYAEGEAPYRDLPLAVLVNRESASSSEVVAGALQDLDRAVIIGEQTFGKGLVQTTRPLPHGGIFKITTAKYYTPSGRCIQAIDYAHRNASGAVEYIPDSLIRSFKTLNGRTVYDGGGIWPDILQKPDEYSPLIISLYVNKAFFAFANKYQQSHATIADIASFQLTEEDVKDFVSFVKEQGYIQRNPLFDMLKRVDEMSREVAIADTTFKQEMTKMRSILNQSITDQYLKQKDTLKNFLAEEIISRYYYRAGRLAYTLPTDKVLAHALQLLQQPDSLQKILKELSPKDLRSKSASAEDKR